MTAGLSLRDLAGRAGTSHATLVAYEAGRTVPRVDTLDRILRAAGYGSDITLSARPDATPEARSDKGCELLQVLELAAQFPTRHGAEIDFPPFPTRPAG